MPRGFSFIFLVWYSSTIFSRIFQLTMISYGPVWIYTKILSPIVSIYHYIGVQKYAEECLSKNLSDCLHNTILWRLHSNLFTSFFLSICHVDPFSDVFLEYYFWYNERKNHFEFNSKDTFGKRPRFKQFSGKRNMR